MVSGMASAQASPEQASRARRTTAGLIDMAVLGGPQMLLRRRGRGAGSSGREKWLERVLGGGQLLLEQQLGTPGERAMGLRTVDRRTGRRVVLWRSVVLVLATAGTQALRDFASERLAAARRAELEELRQGLRSVEQHPEDSLERDEAMSQVMRAQGEVSASLSCWWPLALAGALALVQHQLRRRLAPTVVVRAGGIAEHGGDDVDESAAEAAHSP
jgi:hypothetical protein